MPKNIVGKRHIYKLTPFFFSLFFFNVQLLDGYRTADSHEQLLRTEVPDAHYLETRSFCWRTIHILCNARTLVLLIVLLQRKHKLVLIFIILLEKCFTYNFFFLPVSVEVGFEPEIL
jgi:hypothetical protein